MKINGVSVSGGASIMKLTGQTLNYTGWTLSQGNYEYNFSNLNIDVDTTVSFTPDNDSYTEITTCGLLVQVNVSNGSCKFYSIFPPQTNITGSITIFPVV
jgi:hypothetical protein